MSPKFEIPTNPIGKYRNILLMILFALATLIIFDIGTVSLSFIFGALLIVGSLENFRFYFIPKGLGWFLAIYVAIALVSIVLSEVPAIRTTPVRAVQLIYWLLLALFVCNSYDSINKNLLSQVILVSVLTFLIFDVTFLDTSPNAVAFTAIILGPIGYYTLRKYYLKIIYAVVLIFLILLNGSRTGSVLIVLQTIIMLVLFTPRLYKHAKILLTIILILLLSLNLKSLRIALGESIKPFNTEMAALMIDPVYVFRNDMSWLERRAQINKGLQIFKQHPVLGIGAFTFPRYSIVIDVSNIERDRKKLKGIDNRSAHNTYIEILAETGIIGFSTFILMFSLAIFPFLKRLNDLGNSFEGCVFITILGLLGYFYLISGFYGTSAWITYGLILGASTKLSER